MFDKSQKPLNLSKNSVGDIYCNTDSALVDGARGDLKTELEKDY
jgi:hypothetical protein